mgnify:CR=1 FL=1
MSEERIKREDESLLINYGYDNNRIFMQYNVGGKDRKKTYVGSCEYIEENGKTKVLTYLEGPMGVFAVHVDDGEEYINYIHKDNHNLHSVTVIEETTHFADFDVKVVVGNLEANLHLL